MPFDDYTMLCQFLSDIIICFILKVFSQLLLSLLFFTLPIQKIYLGQSFYICF